MWCTCIPQKLCASVLLQGMELRLGLGICSLRLQAEEVDLSYQQINSYLDLALCLSLASQAASSVSHCFLWSILNVVSGFEFHSDTPLITLHEPRDHFLFTRNSSYLDHFLLRVNDCIPLHWALLSNLMCVTTQNHSKCYTLSNCLHNRHFSIWAQTTHVLRTTLNVNNGPVFRLFKHHPPKKTVADGNNI